MSESTWMTQILHPPAPFKGGGIYTDKKSVVICLICVICVPL